jgi:hypothetical protein
MARIPDVELERLKVKVSVKRLVEVSGIALTKTGKDLLNRCLVTTFKAGEKAARTRVEG